MERGNPSKLIVGLCWSCLQLRPCVVNFTNFGNVFQGGRHKWYGLAARVVKRSLEIVVILPYNDSNNVLKRAAGECIILSSYGRMQVIIVSTVKDRLGPMVRSKRKTLEMSQEELAVRLDKSTGAVGQMERGETMPGLETLQAIIDTLNLDPRVLFCNEVPNDSDMLEVLMIMRQINPEKRQLLLGIARLMAQQGD